MTPPHGVDDDGEDEMVRENSAPPETRQQVNFKSKAAFQNVKQ